ncbi:MAG: DNA primase [Verrucomicrobia bacterium]|nr:DNA primase [Verrucomicrobiota bacterium]MBS0636010.1 DNA primase [Verrucomicrobiota bacterium]
MAKYTKESLETLRSRIDLAEVLGQHIDLKKAGGSMKALCPFHEERSPSFVVNRGDTHYHCFGCGAHGDAIQFLMQHLRLTFTDAVQQLAERFQVDLELQDKGHDVKHTNKARLKDALDTASRFYQTYLLHTTEGRGALDYLRSRGITADFINAFQVGLSPKNEGVFRKYMHQSHFTDAELIEVGLVAERGGKKRDFFQERLMFPILDVTGATIGFSARKMHESTYGGKYINTSETPLFKKSRVLFGLAQSRRRIIKQKQAIIVEGGLDALRMIYHGFDLTVAALGTAFGEDHAHEVCQLGVTRVFLLFDGDTAGQEASVKVGNLFQKRGVEVLVATLKQGQDPDSMLVKEGPIAISQAILKAEEYLTFLWHHYAKTLHTNSPAEKNKMVQELVQRIREWDNPVMVHESLKKLAALTEVPEELLGIDVLQPRTLHFKRSVNSGPSQQIDPDRIVEQDLLRWLILYGPSSSDVLGLCQRNIQPADFRIELAKKVYEQVLATLLEKKELDLLQLTADIEGDDMPIFLSEVLNKKVNREKVKEHLTDTIQRIKERNWMHEREAVKMKIHSGKASEDELMALVKQFDELKKRTPTIL